MLSLKIVTSSFLTSALISTIAQSPIAGWENKIREQNYLLQVRTTLKERGHSNQFIDSLESKYLPAGYKACDGEGKLIQDSSAIAKNKKEALALLSPPPLQPSILAVQLVNTMFDAAILLCREPGNK